MNDAMMNAFLPKILINAKFVSLLIIESTDNWLIILYN